MSAIATIAGVNQVEQVEDILNDVDDERDKDGGGQKTFVPIRTSPPSSNRSAGGANAIPSHQVDQNPSENL